jgi:hypothetical protein
MKILTNLGACIIKWTILPASSPNGSSHGGNRKTFEVMTWI